MLQGVCGHQGCPRGGGVLVLFKVFQTQQQGQGQQERAQEETQLDKERGGGRLGVVDMIWCPPSDKEIIDFDSHRQSIV